MRVCVTYKHAVRTRINILYAISEKPGKLIVFNKSSTFSGTFVQNRNLTVRAWWCYVNMWYIFTYVIGRYTISYKNIIYIARKCFIKYKFNIGNTVEPSPSSWYIVGERVDLDSVWLNSLLQLSGLALLLCRVGLGYVYIILGFISS